MEIDLEIAKALNSFSSNIIMDNTSCYIQRKKIEDLLKIKFDFNINETFSDKNFLCSKDYLFVIYVILKRCFEMYDAYAQIIKEFMEKYLKEIKHVYYIDIKRLIKQVIYLDDTHDKTIISYLEKYNNDLKTLIQNVQWFETRISKEIFLNNNQEKFLKDLNFYIKPLDSERHLLSSNSIEVITSTLKKEKRHKKVKKRRRRRKK